MSWTTPEAVIFDLDDTLSDHLHCAREGLRALAGRHGALAGVGLSELEARYSVSLEHHHRRMLDGEISQSEARTERMVELFASVGVSIDAEMAMTEYRLMRVAYDEAARVVPGTREVLERLVGAGVRLAIITNNLVAEQTAKLDSLGLTTHFEVVTISEAVGIAKPEPAIFHMTLEALGVPVERVVMVGDSLESDIGGARRVDMRAVWIDRLDVGAHTAPPDVRRLVGDLSETDLVVSTILG